jgi:hypothetical protein
MALGIAAATENVMSAVPTKDQSRAIVRWAHWISIDSALPDADMPVLMALGNHQVEPGFYDGDCWRFLSAEPCETPVKFWAHYPEPPNLI